MRLSNQLAAASIALACAASAHAQGLKTETELKVKDGKDVTVVGCVEHDGDGPYLLTHVADRKQALPNYVLATKDDLTKHIGHRVEISASRPIAATARSRSRPRPRRATCAATIERSKPSPRSRGISVAFST